MKQGPLEEVVLREVKNIDSIGWAPKWAIREQEGLEDPACEDWDVRVSTYDTTFKWEIKFDSWILLFYFFHRFYLIQNIRAILFLYVLYLIK